MLHRWSARSLSNKAAYKCLSSCCCCCSHELHYTVVAGARLYCTTTETRTRAKRPESRENLSGCDDETARAISTSTTAAESATVSQSILLAMVQSGRWAEALERVKNCTAEGVTRSQLLTSIVSSLLSSSERTYAEGEKETRNSSSSSNNSPAFAVWSAASSTMGYTAPPRLLHRLAAHSLFVDGNSQEALDLLMISNALRSEPAAATAYTLDARSTEDRQSSLDSTVAEKVSEMWLSYMAHHSIGQPEDAWNHLVQLTAVYAKTRQLHNASLHLWSPPHTGYGAENGDNAVSLSVVSLILHAWVHEAYFTALNEPSFTSSSSPLVPSSGKDEVEDSQQQQQQQRGGCPHASLPISLLEKYLSHGGLAAENDKSAVVRLFEAVELLVLRGESGVRWATRFKQTELDPSLFVEYSLVPCNLAYAQACATSLPPHTNAATNVELRRAAYHLYDSYSAALNTRSAFSCTHSSSLSNGSSSVSHPSMALLNHATTNGTGGGSSGAEWVSMGQVMLGSVTSRVGGNDGDGCMERFAAGLARCIINGSEEEEEEKGAVQALRDRGPNNSSSSRKTANPVTHQSSRFASVLLAPLDAMDDSPSRLSKQLFGKLFMEAFFSQSVADTERRVDGVLLRCFGTLLPYLESCSTASREGDCDTTRRTVFLGETRGFLVGVLEAVCLAKSNAGKDDCAQWHRVVSKLVKLLVLPAYKHSCQDLPIPVSLQRSLHRLWWLPELLEHGSASAKDEAMLAQLVNGGAESETLTGRDGGATSERVRHLRSIILAWNEKALSSFDGSDGNRRRTAWLHGARKEGTLESSGHTMAHNLVMCEWLVAKLPSTASEHLNFMDAVAATLTRCSNYHRSDLVQNVVHCLLSPCAYTTERGGAKRPVSLLESIAHARLSDDPPLDYFLNHHIPFLIAVLHWIPVLPSLSSLHAMFTPHTFRAHKGNSTSSVPASDREEQAFQSFISQTIILYAARAVETSSSSGNSNSGSSTPPSSFSSSEGSSKDASHFAARQAAALLVEAGALWTESAIVDSFTVRAVIRALRRSRDVEGCEGFLSVVFYRLCLEKRYKRNTRSETIQLALLHRSCPSKKVTSYLRGDAIRCIVDIAMEYVMACWEDEEYESILKVLFVKSSGTEDEARACEEVVRRVKRDGVKHAGDGAWSSLPLIHEDIGFLLPKTARAAIRLLVILHANTRDREGKRREKLVSAALALNLEVLDDTAGRTGYQHRDVLLLSVPKRHHDLAAVEKWVVRLGHVEPEFCQPSRVVRAAQKVLLGSVSLRDACEHLLQPAQTSDENAGSQRAHRTYHPNREKRSRKSGINVLIDSGHWAEALRVIPTVLTDPKHILRKCLIACEAAPTGSSWVGALQTFDHFLRKHPDVLSTKEIGRVAVIAANAKQWEATLGVFRAAGPAVVDEFLFAQVAYALTASNQHDELIGLWAEWRSMVGDRVNPTPKMVSRFINAGYRGSSSTAFAVCDLLIRASRQKLESSPGGQDGPSAVVPGSALHVDVPATEQAVTALLSSRWKHSWKQAVQVAVAIRSQRVTDTVARKTPQNSIVFDVLAKLHGEQHGSSQQGQREQEQQVEQDQLLQKEPMDVSTRHALVYQLDVAKLLDKEERDCAPNHSKHQKYDSVSRVLDLLLDDSQNS